MKPKKTWREKIDNSRPPEVQTLDKAFSDMQVGEQMLISSPKEIEDFLYTIPSGTVVSVKQLRQDLAKTHGATNTCPLTTGIFLRIVAEAALEAVAAGKAWTAVAPFWRVVEPKSPLAKKLADGPNIIQAQREREGIQT
jgi:hypothetical protein